MSEKIDINVADAETLTTIAGIGPALAQRIIEYRETVHPYEEVIELAAVPGISEKMVRGFEESVTVEPITPSPPLLEAPEPMELLETPEPIDQLEAPEQPVALLPELEEQEEAAVVEDEVIGRKPEAIAPVAEDIEETAVPPASSSDPDIEAIALAEPDPTMPEPNMRASIPAQPPDTWNKLVQRRGCLNTLLGATFGAILGAVLTLALLAWLNSGSLNYAESNTQLRQQLDTEIISRTNELNTLSTRVSLVATEEAAANEALRADFDDANEAINAELARDDEIISYLATRDGSIELRLREVAGAADTFINFLDGLQTLLDNLDGTAVPSSSQPTATPSAEDATSSPTPTPFSLDTPQPTAAQPTRTPQPTATPFTFPTNTPAPQP